MQNQNINLKQGATLQNDNVFPTNKIVSLSALTGLPTRKGLERALISDNQIVNVVSNVYGHLPNEKFFNVIEEKLIEEDVNYITRSINRDNRSFAVDYILQDDNLHVNVKNGMDKIKPMLRFTNSYDGSCKTSGHFGFFREVCSNGLHVAHSEIGFSVKHKGDIVQFVLPEINELVRKFMSNEFYEIQRKFEVLAETPVNNPSQFVKMVCDKLKLFQYASSEKNPDPSLNARMVIDIMNNEASLLKTRPNLWIGYNAFNAVLHDKLKKTFEGQKVADQKIFEHVFSLV